MFFENTGGLKNGQTTNERGGGGGINDEAMKLYYMREFRDQLIQFLDELIEQFPLEGEFVLIRIFLKDQVAMTDVIGRFMRDLLPLKDLVVGRNEKFFLENTFLYMGDSGIMATDFMKDRVNHFKRLWVSDQLNDEDRKVMWKWMDLFMQIAELYYQKFGHIQGWEPKPKVK
jgi:hypothetical protein